MTKSEDVHLKASIMGKGESSDQVRSAKEWKHLWSIKALPKMKIVLWRFAHNCLPTGQKLRIRSIPAYDLCCHCGRDETVEHAFLTCQYVMEIWKELKKRCDFRRLTKPFGPPDSGFLKLWLIVRIEMPLSLPYPFAIFGKLEMLSVMVKMMCIHTV